MKRDWLKDIRLSNGFTQAYVADKAEMSRAYYTEIESGVKRPSPAVAQKLAKVLSFDWTIFFTNKSCDKQQTTA